jgi:hypothetical protein
MNDLVQDLPAIITDPSYALDLARIEIDQSVVIAKRDPRSIDTAIKRMRRLAIYNDTAAESCIYSLPRRDGKPLIGPSTNLSDVVYQSWGNCRVHIRRVGIDRREKVVSAEGLFTDLETNSTLIMPADRSIIDKNGRLYPEHLIGTTMAAAISIAKRNVIFRAVPRAMWYPIYEEALRVIRGDEKTMAARKAKAFELFEELGVSPDKIIGAFGLKGENELTLDHLVSMRGMYSTLKAGEVTIEEMFDPRRLSGQEFEKVQNPLADEAPGGAAEAQAAPAPTQEVSAPPSEAPAKPKRGRPKTAKAEETPLVRSTPIVVETNEQGAIANITITQPVVPYTVQESDKDIVVSQPGPIPQADPAVQTISLGTGQPITVELPPGVKIEKPEKPQLPPRPSNFEEYCAYLKAWLAKCTSETEVDELWRQDHERDLRAQCRVFTDKFDHAKGMKDERVIELRRQAGK